MKNNKNSERISKVIARSSQYSRRQVEQLIIEGRVKIDGDFWQAKEINGKYVSVGTRVKVINYQSIVLIIKIIK